jgi:hypothetical protein
MWKVEPELRECTDTLLYSLDSIVAAGGDPAASLECILAGAADALRNGAAVSNTVSVLREAMDRLEALIGDAPVATSPPPWENN